MSTWNYSGLTAQSMGISQKAGKQLLYLWFTFFFFFLASPTEISTQMKIMKARSHHGASTDALMQFNNSTQEQTMTAALGSTDVWSSGKTNE